MRVGISTSTLLFILTLLPFIGFNIAYYGGFVEGAVSGDDAVTVAGPTAAQLAEQDSSSDLPGRFVPSQGKNHTGDFPLAERIDFCEPGRTEGTCYASNPPTSGLHLRVMRDVTLESGDVVTLPPDPGIYAFAIPREAIPHIEEHAGVYLGYNCATAECDTAVQRATDLVTEEVALGQRVVMSPDPDLDPDTMALASWTRIDAFAAAEYADERARRFIEAHSCRYDPERFCPEPNVN